MGRSRTVHITKTILQEKKFAECKDREGCIDYYTKSAYESLSPKENYFRELKDCTPEKCVKHMRCYDTTGCGDFYSALPTDKLPQGVFKTEDAEKCKTECKKYVQCHETEGCKDYWSSLPADQLPKNVFPTLEECQKKCQAVYKCKCEGECKKVHTQDPQQPFYLTEIDCKESKECKYTSCEKDSSAIFARRWGTLIVFFVVLLLSIVTVIYHFATNSNDKLLYSGIALAFTISMGAFTAYYYGSGDYLKSRS